MKNIILVLFLFFTVFRIFSQGSYCSRGIVEEASTEDANNQTYLSKRIIGNNANIAELFVEFNNTIGNHYTELEKKNEAFIKERALDLNCAVESGFCGVFSIEVFGFFQDGVFDNFDLSKSHITNKEQNLTSIQIANYLKKNYANKNQDVPVLKILSL